VSLGGLLATERIFVERPLESVEISLKNAHDKSHAATTFSLWMPTARGQRDPSLTSSGATVAAQTVRPTSSPSSHKAERNGTDERHGLATLLGELYGLEGL
jgi:hypothetical protein